MHYFEVLIESVFCGFVLPVDEPVSLVVAHPAVSCSTVGVETIPFVFVPAEEKQNKTAPQSSLFHIF